MPNHHRRGPWSQGEDSFLLQLVHDQGPNNWVRIAQQIGSRTPKQCRERYHQNLKPTLNHEPISPEEGLLIEKLVGEMGKRWAEIARRLHGRSDNAVKNWWNGGMNRRRRLCNRRGDSSRCGAAFNERTEQLSFARPVETYDHCLLTTNISPARRSFDTPLPSPSLASETSRADSAEGAPSLVSDSASSFSVSPRIPASPSIELPPLIGTRAESRRPSFPMLHLGTNMFISDSEPQTPSFGQRFDTERKAYEPHTPRQLSAFYRPAQPFESSPSSQEYHHLRDQLSPMAASQTDNQLPPLRSLSYGGDRIDNRDTRMTLSNILD